jgi:hypothetical protein
MTSKKNVITIVELKNGSHAPKPVMKAGLKSIIYAMPGLPVALTTQPLPGLGGPTSNAKNPPIYHFCTQFIRHHHEQFVYKRRGLN